MLQLDVMTDEVWGCHCPEN